MGCISGADVGGGCVRAAHVGGSREHTLADRPNFSPTRAIGRRIAGLIFAESERLSRSSPQSLVPDARTVLFKGPPSKHEPHVPSFRARERANKRRKARFQSRFSQLPKAFFASRARARLSQKSQQVGRGLCGHSPIIAQTRPLPLAPGRSTAGPAQCPSGSSP